MVRERANERACDRAIKKTLAYRAVFKYPLSFYQLWQFLLTPATFKKSFFERELSKMVKKGYIGFRDGKYFDKRIKPVSWEFRQKYSNECVSKVKKLSKFLEKLPWIKLLCVTGSVAAYNADRESDIDIFIVAKTHRLWLTRGFTVLMLKILGAYVNKDADPGKLCPNLFIDETAFTWPYSERSVFTAHEIVLMQPILNRDRTYEKFMDANAWVKEHFANVNVVWESDYAAPDKSDSRLVNLAEKLAKFVQLKYMQKKRTTELIGDHIIHFKKNDNTVWILDEYKRLAK